VACAAVLAVAALGIDGDLFAAESPRLSDACIYCHQDQQENLAGTVHELSDDALDGPDARIACTDCHQGDSRHWEDDPEAYPMTNPSALGAIEEAHLCSGCHQTSHQQSMLEGNPHAAADVSCSSCHGVHGSGHATLLKQDQPGLCWGCHGDVEGQFAKPYRHPVNDGIVQCTECHLSLDVTSRELTLNGTNVCLECHNEFEGPFPYEHMALRDYSTEEGGCVTCHEPHGSYHPRMLNQPYESPHFQLCSQCHAVPLHNSNVMHGTQWAGVACNTCHIDVHGSYSNRRFLDESLQLQGCFNAGCHQF
jgi:DmsE family decaheme c-type cytochrome